MSGKKNDIGPHESIFFEYFIHLSWLCGLLFVSLQLLLQ